MKELGTLNLFETFVYEGKKYVILRHDGNMVEVKEQDGRHWSWPKQAKVNQSK